MLFDAPVDEVRTHRGPGHREDDRPAASPGLPALCPSAGAGGRAMRRSSLAWRRNSSAMADDGRGSAFIRSSAPPRKAGPLASRFTALALNLRHQRIAARGRLAAHGRNDATGSRPGVQARGLRIMRWVDLCEIEGFFDGKEAPPRQGPWLGFARSFSPHTQT